MTLIDRILNQLADGGGRQLTDLLAMTPELAAEPNGAEVLRLLLRLDRRFRLRPDGRWSLAATAPTPADRIVASAQVYLDRIPGGGATLNSLVNYVVGETGYEPARARSIITSHFVNNGRLVRNKRQETR